MRRPESNRAARAAEMRAVVEEFEGAGTGQAEFCRRRGLALSTFQYWRRRTAQARRDRFAEVEIVGAPATAAVHGVELVLAGGVVARIGPGSEEETIRRLLRAAGAAC